MNYSINKLSKLAGVSTRTLRYYDEIGLLVPKRRTEADYRIYDEQEVDALQQILFYRALGMELLQIKALLHDRQFDKEQALEQHLSALLQKRAQLDLLIENAGKTLATLKGEQTMTDVEKFEGFKEQLIAENEEQYGAEIRQKYGDKLIDASNAHLKGMTPQQYAKAQSLSEEINALLIQAVTEGNPTGETAQKACALHEQWLRMYYLGYTREYHRYMGELYVSDERFAANYNRLAPNCAAFFCEAIQIYCQ